MGRTMWDDFVHWTMHGTAGVTILGAMSGVLPPIAALIGVIYYGIQIFESKTMQDWLARRRLAKIVKLRKQLAQLIPPEQ